MIVYLETSIILRRLLKQTNSLAHWEAWTLACTSTLSRVEALRTLDRIRLQGKMSDAELADAVQNLDKILRKTDRLSLNSYILNRAAQPFPTVIGTLDAIHLASASLWQERYQKEIIFLTHDIQLGRAALAMGMRAVGFDR